MELTISRFFFRIKKIPLIKSSYLTTIKMNHYFYRLPKFPIKWIKTFPFGYQIQWCPILQNIFSTLKSIVKGEKSSETVKIRGEFFFNFSIGSNCNKKSITYIMVWPKALVLALKILQTSKLVKMNQKNTHICYFVTVYSIISRLTLKKSIPKRFWGMIKSSGRIRIPYHSYICWIRFG